MLVVRQVQLTVVVIYLNSTIKSMAIHKRPISYLLILGIISIFFMMGAFLNGTIALWAPEIRKWIKPVYSRWFHNVIGIIAFAIGMASIRYNCDYYCQHEICKFELFICSSHGYDLRDFRTRSTVPYMYALKWAAYITTVLSLIGAIKSLYEQTKGVVLTVKNSLSSSASELPLKE